VPLRPRASYQRILLGGTAVFAILWVTARASVQSVTVDEADCYLSFVEPPWPSHWTAASQNHVLNSVLMRLFTSVFGLSHLTLRAPALIGAAIYVFAAYRFCVLLTEKWILRWAVLLCLAYNPFLMDYLVAARGYSLAVAFLTCTVLIAAHDQIEILKGHSRSPAWACSLCSICAALSFAANFSFAFVAAAVMLLIFIWACRRGKSFLPLERPTTQRVRILTACILPGFLVTLFFSASALLRWPAGQLEGVGSTSLVETVRSIVDSSLYALNPHLVNPLLYPVLDRLKDVLLPGLGALSACQFFLVFRNWSSPRDALSGWLTAVASLLAGAVAVSLSVHWLSFRLFHLLLPKERTGIYLVPLCTLLAGAAAAIPVPSRLGRLCRRALTFVLLALGCYFLLCLRLTYFKEWEFNADVRSAYSVVSYFHHTHGVKDISASWLYVAPLNFYRHLSGSQTIAKFERSPTDPTDPGFKEVHPANKQVYVLSSVRDHDFISDQKLKVVYQGARSELVVAIRAELEGASPRIAGRGAVPP